MPIRTIVIERRQAGQTVAEVLRATLRLARPAVLERMRRKQIRLDGHICQVPGRRVRHGQRLQIHLPPPGKKSPHHQERRGGKPTTKAVPKPSPLAKGVRILYLDPHLLVVEKPAGLTTVRHADEVEEFSRRARKFLPPTLVDLLPALLPPQERKGRPRAVHRLDKETSGLVVLARTSQAERHLGLQFRAHTIDRQYLALVRGPAKDERIETQLVRDRGDGRRGTISTLASGELPSGGRQPPGKGQCAVTLVKVLETLGPFTLVECRLETGRTHQIRIHLGERGTPLCGERIYDRPLHGKPWPDTSGASRPLLHGAALAIDHPASGQRLTWTSNLPNDFATVLSQLRGKK